MKTINILKKTLQLLFCSVWMYSCGPNVQTVNSDADLSAYDTFAYLPNANNSTKRSAADAMDVNTAIVETVNDNLRAEGLRLDRDTPDLLVLISTKTETETGVSTDPIYATYPYTYPVTTVSPYYSPYYYHRYPDYTNLVGFDTDTYDYTEGTVVVDLIDRETRETVWKGVTTTSIYDENTTAAIADLVDEVFDEYPSNNL